MEEDPEHVIVFFPGVIAVTGLTMRVRREVKCDSEPKLEEERKKNPLCFLVGSRQSELMTIDMSTASLIVSDDPEPSSCVTF